MCLPNQETCNAKEACKYVDIWIDHLVFFYKKMSSLIPAYLTAKIDFTKFVILKGTLRIALSLFGGLIGWFLQYLSNFSILNLFNEILMNYLTLWWNKVNSLSWINRGYDRTTFLILDDFITNIMFSGEPLTAWIKSQLIDNFCNSSWNHCKPKMAF